MKAIRKGGGVLLFLNNKFLFTVSKVGYEHIQRMEIDNLVKIATNPLNHKGIKTLIKYRLENGDLPPILEPFPPRNKAKYVREM